MNAEELKKAVAEVLPNVDVVIAYGQGFDAAHGEPCFVTKQGEVDNLILNPLCEYNLASYLPSQKNKKTGVVVKGCDSRTIVQFLQEGLIKRARASRRNCGPGPNRTLHSPGRAEMRARVPLIGRWLQGPGAP